MRQTDRISTGRLWGWVAALAIAAAPGCTSPVETSAQNPSSRQVEIEILRLTNAYRRSQSLPPVREAPALADLARGHSSDLAQRRPRHVDHLGMRDRFDRASESIPLISFSENVARMGRKRPEPATWVVEGWVASDSHRKNIEGNYDLVGIGVFRREDGYYFFTQIFGGTPKTRSPLHSVPASPER